MKKVFACMLCFVLLLALAGCGDGENDAGKTAAGDVVEMKMINLVPEDDPLDISMRYLAEILEERSEGRIKVTIHGNKSISSSNDEEAEMIANDMAQFGTTPAYILAGLNRDLKNFYIFDMPYIFEGFEELWAFGESDIMKEMLARVEDELNIKAYPVVGNGLLKIGSNGGEILKPEDIAGQKIRTSTSELHQAIIKTCGANPTPVAWGETFTAVQQGTVDGMMTAAVHYDKEKYYEVLDYMACFNSNTIPHMPIMSATWYNALDDDLKLIVDEAMVDFQKFFQDTVAKTEVETIKNLKDHGMVVTEYTDEQMQVWVDALDHIWTDYADSVGGQAFVDSVLAWRDEYRSGK